MKTWRTEMLGSYQRFLDFLVQNGAELPVGDLDEVVFRGIVEFSNAAREAVTTAFRAERSSPFKDFGHLLVSTLSQNSQTMVGYRVGKYRWGPVPEPATLTTIPPLCMPNVGVAIVRYMALSGAARKQSISDRMQEYGTSFEVERTRTFRNSDPELTETAPDAAITYHQWVRWIITPRCTPVELGERARQGMSFSFWNRYSTRLGE